MSVPENNKVFSLGEGTSIIGRDSKNTVQLLYEHVSRRHAKLEITPDACTIEDLGSSNGTMVNGRKISRQKLADGDEVKIGNCVFRFQVHADDKGHKEEFVPRQFSDKSVFTTAKLKPASGFLKSLLKK
jgi:pSer/pThr/pTyr-binding forkhead associated (FHA) protein